MSLANLNILPMLANFFVPMYQDQSFTGRVLSLLLRFVWVIIGTLLQLLLTIPLVGIAVVWLALPIACHVQLIRSIF